MQLPHARPRPDVDLLPHLTAVLELPLHLHDLPATHVRDGRLLGRGTVDGRLRGVGEPRGGRSARRARGAGRDGLRAGRAVVAPGAEGRRGAGQGEQRDAGGGGENDGRRMFMVSSRSVFVGFVRPARRCRRAA
ncbi:MAG: hypothetical protein ABS81_23255 [Pseudonocardia sp. SCN 72-86]|nr:MAG: hypothetical protein ABS81_23255 [Pseudonocardia sp. SCN 72-86]